MGTSEIARLCKNLSIKDEDRDIHQVTEEIGEVGVEDVDHCLVGKVLCGKRVNREAFRSVIEQLWSPFGNVEIEVVGENTFLFYFKNPNDRNRVWQRGPWHFDKSLIVLEKSEGTGDISQLSFSKAEFWVQIHDIDYVYESKNGEVASGTNRPLKRWFRLKLDKSDKVVVVGLKYERLPEFCYACGQIGHGRNECNDEEAKREAIKGPITKFGSWMRASSSEKVKFKSPSNGSGGSSEKGGFMGESREQGKTGTSTSGSTSLAVQKGGAISPVTESLIKATREQVKTLGSGPKEGEELLDRMCVDGPFIGPVGQAEEKTRDLEVLNIGPSRSSLSPTKVRPVSLRIDGGSTETGMQLDTQKTGQVPNLETQTPTKVKGKKWKHAARETQTMLKSSLMASPLQRKLLSNLSTMKTNKRNSPSPTQSKDSPKDKSDRKQGKGMASHRVSPTSQGQSEELDPEWRPQGGCKRRVFFECKEEIREKAKATAMEISSSNSLSATEPVDQAHREP
ncbi:hypothetical protein EZV62_027882 [Acer yangbiense]|uniref:CCHC-type domain-containing protein n=1 Tax=Acer yangbiense TaxID=1000413 RepID=A0A5C7GPQ7_9ROSI|nr:hypothetical protein EZV62_027882 [Acer yangbiense]